MSGSSATGNGYRLWSTGSNGVEHLRGEVDGRRVNGLAFWHSERLAWLVMIEAHDGGMHAFRHEPSLHDAFDLIVGTVRAEPGVWDHARDAA
jgi:hypothetical protein